MKSGRGPLNRDDPPTEIWVEALVDLGDGKLTRVRGKVSAIEPGQVLRDVEIAPGEPRQ